jgi:hypothetical protein
MYLLSVSFVLLLYEFLFCLIDIILHYNCCIMCQIKLTDKIATLRTSLVDCCKELSVSQWMGYITVQRA